MKIHPRDNLIAVLISGAVFLVVLYYFWGVASSAEKLLFILIYMAIGFATKDIKESVR